MTQLIKVLNKPIRILDGLYSLNDLHKAAGNALKHQPTKFIRNEQTKELITEINRSPNLVITALEVLKGNRKDGRTQGTWVCKELVYAYAMWISPKFHLAVIRSFDEQVNQQRNPALVPNHQLVPLHKPMKQQMLVEMVDGVAVSSRILSHQEFISTYDNLASHIETDGNIPPDACQSVIQACTDMLLFHVSFAEQMQEPAQTHLDA